jgi:hypothetical protein
MSRGTAAKAGRRSLGHNLTGSAFTPDANLQSRAPHCGPFVVSALTVNPERTGGFAEPKRSLNVQNAARSCFRKLATDDGFFGELHQGFRAPSSGYRIPLPVIDFYVRPESRRRVRGNY